MPLIPPAVAYFEQRIPAQNVSKFWAFRFEATVKGAGCAVHIWWGRIGTAGQDKVFAYATDTQAQADADVRLSGKLREGYKRVSGPIDWYPAFVRQADREPSANRRPPSWGVPPPPKTQPAPGPDGTNETWLRRGIELAKERQRDKTPEPSVLRKRKPAETQITAVVISTRRVIDFEE